MGMNINSNLSQAKLAQELTNATNDLSSIINKNDDAGRKNELTKLFSQSYFNSTTEKTNISSRIKNLQEKIATSKKKIEELKKNIDKKQVQLEKISNELADEIAAIVEKTGKMEQQYKDGIRSAIEEAKYEYKTGSTSEKRGGNKDFNYFLKVHMKSLDRMMIGQQSDIQDAISALDVPQSKVNNLASGVKDYVDEISSLEKSYSTEASTLQLLNATSAKMSEAANSYVTSDLDPSIPVFTPEKAEVADNFLATYSSRFDSGNSTTMPTSYEDKKASLLNTFFAENDDVWVQQDLRSENGVGGWITAHDETGKKISLISLNNPQLVSFNNAMDKGLIEQMQNLGFTKTEVVDFIAEKYPSIYIYPEGNKVCMPSGCNYAGSGGKAGSSEVYSKFRNSYNNYQELEPPVGNIGQINELNQALDDGIIGEMKNSNFSFKESAYTLTKLFPDSGIEFTCGQKSITIPDETKDSNGAFDKLAQQILDNFEGVEVKRTSGTYKKSEGYKEKHIDPVGFSVGNTSFEFITDRNNDGKFDFSEMVGAGDTDGLVEMQSYDLNGDGVIESDELDNLFLLKTSHGATSADKTNYEFTSAKDAGISSINLNAFKKETQSRGSDEFVDINNSIVKGSFEVTLNSGEKVEGYQKDVTESFKDTVYKPIIGQNTTIKLSDDEIQSGLKSYDSAKDEMKELIDFKDSYNPNWTGDVRQALSAKLTAAMNNAIGEKNSIASKEIINYSKSGLGNTKEEETDLTEEEADGHIGDQLDNTEEEGYGTKLKEDLQDKGYLKKKK